MRRNKSKNRKIKLLPGSILYFVLLIYSFILTQLLRNAVSGALFLFVLTLPLFSLIQCLIGRSAIQAYVSSEKQRAEKNEQIEYEIRIVNSTFLSYPFVEAVIREPSESAVKCTNKRFVFSLTPFGAYHVRNKVQFKYRGLYEIGIESMYISDLFRFFAIRADMENFAAVSVMPRVLTIVDERGRASTDAPSAELRRDVTAEKNELSDIREYIPGDSVRDIHWKLSSKTQDLMVRQYSSAENRHTYIICDTASSFRPPERKSALDIYDSLKKYVESENEKDRRRRLAKSIEGAMNAGLIEKAAEGEEKAVMSKRAKRRAEAKYRKNIRSGMSETEAETIKSIDELIKSSSKRRYKPDKEKEAPVSAPETEEKTEGASEKVSDMTRILSMTEIPDLSTDVSDRVFGGRVKAEEEEDYDEFCLDTVVEMSLAALTSEINKGSVCTVLWYDSRADGGIYSSTLRDSLVFDELISKLATVEKSPYESYAANLASVIPDANNVTLKIVTSNIDPQSTSQIAALPARFGGSVGCSVEAIIFSPAEKYEDPAFRAVYTGDAASELSKCGITPTVLTEGKDGSGAPVFVALG